MTEAQGDNFVMRDSEQAEGDRKKQDASQKKAAMPEINFSSFILSLGSSALYHFGEIPDPVSGEKQRNLDMARQTIDILVVLRDKTTGNLSDEEARLLESLLHDLQMRYVQETKK
jgi:hypothetical protein